MTVPALEFGHRVPQMLFDHKFPFFPYLLNLPRLFAEIMMFRSDFPMA